MVPFTIIAIVAAIVPTTLYTLFIWWLDRYEKEPLPLLVAAFLWGSLPAIMLALIAEIMLGIPTAHFQLGASTTSWIIAPIVEEPVKAIALIALFIFARREFNGVLDGIVYGALVGFGFAMTENLLYFLVYPADFNILFWLRNVFFGFNHALFTSIVGLALGAVRYASQRWLGYVVLPLSLVVATIFHGLHNFAVSFELLGIAFSWVVQSSGVIVVLVIAILSWHHEQRWITQELGEEIVLGTISASDYAEVASAPRRTQVHLHALAQHGVSHYLQSRRLHHLMTELALCKYQLRVGDRFQDCAERDRLRQEIVTLRAAMPEREKAWVQT